MNGPVVFMRDVAAAAYAADAAAELLELVKDASPGATAPSGGGGEQRWAICHSCARGPLMTWGGCCAHCIREARAVENARGR